MTTTEHVEHAEPEHGAAHAGGHDPKPNIFYVQVAAALALITAVEVGLYWHFVDIVWIVIFALIYLIP